MVAFARASIVPPLSCVVADMTALPFADRSFDCVLAITSLCFVEDERKAVGEITRVARRRFALGLLNRNSLLYLKKGPGRASGAYTGARWHDRASATALLRGLPVVDVRITTAVLLPGGRLSARVIERLAPEALPWGSFLAVTGAVVRNDGERSLRADAAGPAGAAGADGGGAGDPGIVRSGGKKLNR